MPMPHTGIMAAVPGARSACVPAGNRATGFREAIMASSSHRGSVRKLLFNLHLFLALGAGVFVVILGITGAIMAFEPELDHLVHWRTTYVKPQGRALPLSAIGAAVRAAFPDARIGGFGLSTSPNLAYQVNTRSGVLAVNQYTGEILGVRRGGMDFLGYVHQLHLRLLLRNRADPGKKIMSWAGVAILLLLVSGLYLWWPLKRIGVAGKASSRRFWFDL